jgi:hypothetical protein
MTRHTPEQKQAALERKRAYRRKTFNWGRLHVHESYPNRVEVPAEVEADRRERALQEPVSVTAACCGDPPPGRSALAAKQRSGRA